MKNNLFEIVGTKITKPTPSKEKSKQKYQILDKISEGAFGTVYNAINTETNEQVAIKQIFKTSERDHSHSIDRQINILKKLKHKRIIRLKQIEQKQFKINMIFEKCPYDVSQLISSLEYPIDKSFVKFIFYQILEAVAYIHDLNILHRDIKPSNILLLENLELKLCDFGSAVQQNEKAIKGEYDIQGFTKWYKAPQLLFGDRKYNTNVDIWSIGCVFAQIINGIPLFCGANQIQQLVKISDLLGSPDPQNWPGIVNLPDYGKILFNKKQKKIFGNFFDQFSSEQVQLAECMLRYENRLSAKQLLKHHYFNDMNTISKKKFRVQWIKKKTEDPYFNYQKLIK